MLRVSAFYNSIQLFINKPPK